MADKKRSCSGMEIKICVVSVDMSAKRILHWNN